MRQLSARQFLRSAIPSWIGATYEYDAFDQLRHYVNGTEEWLYMYDADDERVWSFKVGVSPRFDRWTLRGLDNQIRREFDVTGWAWNSWTTGGPSSWEDFVYRDGHLLESIYPAGQQRHYDVDHLGSPRLVTNFGAAATAYHVYYPYGEEATAFNQDTERLKFTGHERDLASAAGPGDDLDYMHARRFPVEPALRQPMDRAHPDSAPFWREKAQVQREYGRESAVARLHPLPKRLEFQLKWLEFQFKRLEFGIKA